MGDLDNQFQPNILYVVANNTVAPVGVENAAYHESNMHRMSNCEWRDKAI